jgi:L-cysteine S-thiosulfotransferase
MRSSLPHGRARRPGRRATAPILRLPCSRDVVGARPSRNVRSPPRCAVSVSVSVGVDVSVSVSVRPSSRRRVRWIAVLAVLAVMDVIGAETRSPPAAAFRVEEDTIPQAIGGAKGDAERGRALILARESANCILCHALPDPQVRFSGTLGPSLAGVSRKLSVPQLRLRVVDNIRVNPDTIMPSYFRVDGFDRVAAAYRGKPILDAQQVEDIVAYLATLR